MSTVKIKIGGQTLEVAAEQITKGIESGEIALPTDGLVVRSTEDDQTFKNNVLTEGRAAGVEIGRKEIIRGLGIEAEGVHKTPEGAIDALKAWNQSTVTSALEEAKIEPNEKVKALETDLQAVRTNLQQAQQEKESVLQEFGNFKKNQVIQSTLGSLLPDNLLIPKEDMMTIMGSRIKADVDEAGRVVAIDPTTGKPFKNSTTMEPLPIKDVVSNFFAENEQYLKPRDGGAGGGDDSAAGGKQSIEAFTKEMVDRGVAPNSEEFNQHMNERLKNGTLDV